MTAGDTPSGLRPGHRGSRACKLRRSDFSGIRWIQPSPVNSETRHSASDTICEANGLSAIISFQKLGAALRPATTDGSRLPGDSPPVSRIGSCAITERTNWRRSQVSANVPSELQLKIDEVACYRSVRSFGAIMARLCGMVRAAKNMQFSLKHRFRARDASRLFRHGEKREGLSFIRVEF